MICSWLIWNLVFICSLICFVILVCCSLKRIRWVVRILLILVFVLVVCVRCVMMIGWFMLSCCVCVNVRLM